MGNEKETKDNLLKSAKKEFIQKGYQKASLRNICKNAGVTTGALYFFFNDKEDLFGSLVEEPLKNLYNIMKNHYKSEMDLVNQNGFDIKDMPNDMQVAESIVDYMFEYYDEFVLLLIKSQGSKYERVIDDFIKMTEEHYKTIFEEASEKLKVNKLSDYTIHWLAHVQIFSFVELITHNFEKEEAKQEIKLVINILTKGWESVIGTI